MTRFSDRDGNQILQPAVRIEEIQCLSEIYEQEYTLFDLHSDDQAVFKGRESLNKKIRLHKNGDITNLKVDAVINPVQTDLTKPPVGLSKQMFYKGGPMLKQACLEYGSCPVGEAFITEGYELPAKHVIHTAGPYPNSRLSYQERLECLRQSYLSCLGIVTEQEFRSVGLPCLGTGGGGVSLQDGVKIALTTIREWLDAENNKIEHIVFCLYDGNQYSALLKEMVKCFPRGKDAAGIDLEQLAEVPDPVLNSPAWIKRTPILCLKYNENAKDKICYHFHSLANHCHKKLSPLDSEIDRYSDCCIFLLSWDKIYRGIILHSHAINMIELQILRLSHDNNNINENMKVSLYATAKDYLETYLENVTPFEKCIRCEKSSWKSEYGVWSCTRLQTDTGEMPCDHGHNMADLHMIRPRELYSQWPSFVRAGPVQAGPENICQRIPREPTEHYEPGSMGSNCSYTSNPDLFASLADQRDTSVKVELRLRSDNMATTSTAPRHDLPSPGASAQEVRNITGSENGATRNDFITLSHSLTTDTVRPKEYNNGYSRTNERPVPMNNRSNNNSISLSSRLFSSFQSLFSHKSDKSRFSEQPPVCLAQDSDPTEISTDINLAINQVLPTSPNISVKEDSLSKEKPSDHRSLSGNTLQQEREDMREDPVQDLKAHLPGSLKPPAEACENSCHSKSSSSDNNSADSLPLPVKSDGSVNYRCPSNKDLLEMAEALGLKHEELGIRLGLHQSTIERYRGENPHNLKMQGYHILKSWFRKNKPASMDHLFDEMDHCDIDTYELRKKFGSL